MDLSSNLLVQEKRNLLRKSQGRFKVCRMLSQFNDISGALAGVKITKIACGTNHCVALSDTGEVYTWGFGGYGRLGHRVSTFLNRRLTLSATKG